MVFSSLTFLLYFLPIVLILYFVRRDIRWRNGVLLVASLLFYAWGVVGIAVNGEPLGSF